MINKNKLIDLVSLFTMLMVLYYTVFKVSVVAGIVFVVAHAAYEANVLYKRRLANKEYNEFMEQLFTKAEKNDSFGKPPEGNC